MSESIRDLVAVTNLPLTRKLDRYVEAMFGNLRGSQVTSLHYLDGGQTRTPQPHEHVTRAASRFATSLEAFDNDSKRRVSLKPRTR